MDSRQADRLRPLLFLLLWSGVLPACTRWGFAPPQPPSPGDHPAAFEAGGGRELGGGLDRGELGADRPGSADRGLLPFGVAQPVPSLLDPAAADDNDPSLTADQLELYFASTGRPGGVQYEDLWRCQRASRNDPWPKPVLLPLSTSSRDSSPVISPDGLTLAFASNRPGGSGGWDIWLAQRGSRAGAFGAPLPASGLNTAGDELPSSISDDRRWLLFHANRTGITDLYSAVLVNGTWVESKLPLSTPSFDSHAAVTPDGRWLAFDSDRPGGQGLRDLYLSFRDDPGQLFQAPIPIQELNTATNDCDPWISGDLRQIYFARSPDGATSIFGGPAKIYEARR